MKPRILSIALLVTFLLLWQAYGSHSQTAAFFFSTPLRTIQTGVQMIGDGSLVSNSIVTASEAAAGFLLGNLFGAGFGVMLWYSELVARIARPYLVALGALPVFAIAPMTILWFGVGIKAKIALAFLSTVFLAAAQAFKGVQEVDPLLVQRFRIFGANRRVLFTRLLLPSAMVWIISSLRLTFSAALLGAFVGEFIASEQGIGHMIIRASGLYDTPRVLVGVIDMVAMALFSDFGISRLEQRLFRWRA
jgi:NitT/TauT family transport system permease protein